MSTSAPPRPGNSGYVPATLAAGRLGTWQVVFTVMAAAAPLTVVAGSATTGFAVTGFVGVPMAYVAVALILTLFAVGYTAMSRYLRNAGAFYAYVARGLGGTAGVGAAFIAVLAYGAMQVSLYGAFGVVASAVLEAMAGWQVAWWAAALVGWLLVGLLGLARVDLSGRLLAVLIVAEIAIALVFDVALVAHPMGGTVSFAALAPDQLLLPGAGALLVGGIAGYMGVEMTAVFAEEARDPQRTVPRATYLAIGIIGVLYGLSAWAMTVATGPDRIVAEAQAHGTDLFFVLAGRYLPAVLVDVGQLLFLTSLFAALLAFHNTVARYLFSLGRERVVPAVFGRTSRRSGAPKSGSLLQSVVALGVIVLYAVAGWDPITRLFFWIGIGGALGVLILMVATSAAVVGFFARHRYDERWWRRCGAPGLAAVVLGGVLVVTVMELGSMLDVPATAPVRWAIPAAYLAAGLVGIGWALVLRVRRPDIYRAIGLGADAATTSAFPSAQPLSAAGVAR
jgi:amino acid transporter